jgi:hypothetical protein
MVPVANLRKAVDQSSNAADLDELEVSWGDQLEERFLSDFGLDKCHPASALPAQFNQYHSRRVSRTSRRTSSGRTVAIPPLNMAAAVPLAQTSSRSSQQPEEGFRLPVIDK